MKTFNYVNGKFIDDKSKSIEIDTLLSLKERITIFVYGNSTNSLSFKDKLLDRLSTFDLIDIKCQKNNEEFFDYKSVNNYLETAKILKNQSKCLRLKVCCLLVKDGRIISTGINGTPKGYENCCDHFSYVDISKPIFKDIHHIWSNDHEVHAELNAILELGKNTSIDSYSNLELYCTTCPCPNCAKMIAQAGIKTVFYSEAYDRMPEGENLLKSFGVTVIKF